MTIDWKITKLDTVSSTQSELHKNIDSNVLEGTVIHALSQINGTGRHGRVWHEGQGNLYFSFILCPNFSADKIGQLSLTLGLGISDYINKIISQDYNAILKWPNDIMINNKKCCGILIDAAPIIDNKIEYVIVGVGININSAPLDISTYVQKFTDINLNIDIFLRGGLDNISIYYRQWQKYGFDNIREEWLNNTNQKGERISVKSGNKHITGKFETIDLYGNLVLISDENNNKIKISSGDIFLT